jgi:drug/metabolite transporter (DMT)-like permease
MGRGHAKIIAAAVFWSTGSVFIRVVNLPIPEYMWWVTFFAFAILLLKIILQGNSSGIPSVSWKSLSLILAISVISLLNIGLYLLSLRITTIANAILSHYLAPVIVPFAALLLLRESLERTSIIAVIIAFSGLILMLIPNDLILGDVHSFGIFMSAASAVFYAFEMVGRRAASLKMGADIIVIWQFIFFLLILLPLTNPLAIMGIEPAGLLFILLSAVFSTVIPFLLFTSGLGEVKAQQAGVLMYTEVLGGVAWGLLLFSEVPHAITLLGGLMIATAGYMVIRYGGGGVGRETQAGSLIPWRKA